MTFKTIFMLVFSSFAEGQIDWLNRIAAAAGVTSNTQAPPQTSTPPLQQEPKAPGRQDPNELLKSLQKMQQEWAQQQGQNAPRPNPPPPSVPKAEAKGDSSLFQAKGSFGSPVPSQAIPGNPSSSQPSMPQQAWKPVPPVAAPSYPGYPPQPPPFQYGVPSSIPATTHSQRTNIGVMNAKQNSALQGTTDENMGAVEELDLVCGEGWQAVKTLAKERLGNAEACMQPLETSTIHLLSHSMSVALPQHLLATNECGLARLLTQMLVRMASGPQNADESLFQQELLHSPVMTIMLDVPWTAIYQSGWPYFAVLAQWQLRNRQAKGNVLDPRDGLNVQPVLKLYFDKVTNALESGNFDEFASVSNNFLGQFENDQRTPFEYPLPFVTALAGVCMKAGPQEIPVLLQDMQSLLKATIKGPTELIYVLNSQWPIWMLVSLLLT